MQLYQHPGLPWLTWQVLPQGFVATCAVCRVQTRPLTSVGLDQFVRMHAEHRSAAPSHYGAGDVVAGMTQALGIQPCTPCEARRQTLNRMLPRMWRR